jgi:hypothetical protein
MNKVQELKLLRREAALVRELATIQAQRLELLERPQPVERGGNVVLLLPEKRTNVSGG